MFLDVCLAGNVKISCRDEPKDQVVGVRSIKLSKIVLMSIRKMWISGNVVPEDVNSNLF